MENPQVSVSLFFISGSGMLLVALAYVAAVRRMFNERWIWLPVGAGLWAAGLVFKFGVVMVFNERMEELLAAVLPGTIRGAAIALLLGIESSLAELGVVLIAALIWRGMGHSVGRAATIGVGAGAFEALLLAGASLLAGAALALGLLDPALMSSGSAAASATRFLWLLGSVERLIAVMCHVGSRTLVIIGIVQRRMSMVAAGFMIFAGLDSVAAWLHVVGRAGTRSLWWTELGMFPWAVAAAAGLWWCVRVEAGAHCDSSRSGD